jgi:hypothetical protein
MLSDKCDECNINGLDKKMLEVMGDGDFHCQKHDLPHREVVGLLEKAHNLAKQGRLRELNQVYEDVLCPKLKGYVLEVYEGGVKKKAHRLIVNGEIKELDALYRAQKCEKLHEYIMNLYKAEAKWETIRYDAI